MTEPKACNYTLQLKSSWYSFKILWQLCIHTMKFNIQNIKNKTKLCDNSLPSAYNNITTLVQSCTAQVGSQCHIIMITDSTLLS